MSSTQQQRDFWIADWRIKPALTEIEQNGKVIQLEPKVMALLELLASRPDQVFSRQELESSIWQGTIVGYDALSKAVTKLRDALGDDKKNPQYIQTISKKGYRLIAEVRREPLAESSSLELESTRSEFTENKAVIKRQAITGAAIGVFALIALFFLQKQVDKPKPGIVDSVTETVSDISPAKPVPVDDSLSIVVLPFRNISPNENDAYLADGITSDLITDLSRLSGILVTASNVDMESEKVQAELNVRYMLGGDVAKVGQDIRINVRLTDVVKGSILWANRYERKFTDLFAIQDELTQKIVQNLALKLTAEEKQRIARRYTHSLEAYEYFLRAQYHLSARTAEDSVLAREMYQKAIDIDPGFARAYAGIAMMYTVGFVRQWPSDVNNPLEKALELSNRAMKLDNDLPEAYWVAGFISGNQRNTQKATAFLDQALALNPNYADAYAMLSWLHNGMGEPEKALEYISRAIKLKPTGGYLYDIQLGRAHYLLGNYQQALVNFEKARQKNPAYIDNMFYLAISYVNLDRKEDVIWSLTEAKNLNPEFDAEVWLQNFPLFNADVYSKMLIDVRKAKQHLAEDNQE